MPGGLSWLLLACGVAFLFWYAMRKNREIGAMKSEIDQAKTIEEARERVDKIVNKLDAMPIDKVRERLKKWSRG